MVGVLECSTVPVGLLVDLFVDLLEFNQDSAHRFFVLVHTKGLRNIAQTEETLVLKHLHLL